MSIDPIDLLVIDDDEDQYVFLRHLLEHDAAQPYRFRWAATYAEGVAALDETPPDVALVDYRLGGRSGLDLIGEATARLQTRVPLVMLTGHGDRALDLQAMEAGATDYLNRSELTGEILDRTLRYAVRHARALTEVLERESEYRSLFERSPLGMAHATPSGRWLRVNRRLCEMLGYTEDELRGQRFGELVHPDEYAAAKRDVQRLVDGGVDHYEAERRYRRRDGTYLWTNIHAHLHRDVDGQPRYVVAALEDITARKQAESKARRTLDQLQGIVANLPMVLWTLDRDGIVTFSEGRLLERFGAASGEFVGRSQLEMYAADPEILAQTQRALAGESLHFTHAMSNGVFETWYVPLYDADGALVGTMGLAIDVTGRVQLEEQFRQAQKMEAVGRLAGGVAHDFNNLLTAILGYGELALQELPPGSEVRADVEEMYKAGQSAAGLTRQLLAFSRRQVLQPEVIDLNAAVKRMETLLRRVIGEDVALVTSLTSAPALIRADSSQLEQIIVNLAVNARDAMPEGGQLTLETAVVALDAEAAARHQAAGPGAYVQLLVSDSGVGIPEEVQRQLFEPFFTTKQGGKGTGLGLATVYGIVSQSGGAIGVESQIGRGTTFRILLPAVSDAHDGVDERVGPPADIKGTETILLVEDQPEVRAVTRSILQRQGYTVLEADGGGQARAISARAETIDLLLTDIVMPGASGRALARDLQASRPGLRILYMSGYTEDKILHHGVAEAGLPFVQKPFTPATLLAKVREVLDGPPVAGA